MMDFQASPEAENIVVVFVASSGSIILVPRMMADLIRMIILKSAIILDSFTSLHILSAALLNQLGTSGASTASPNATVRATRQDGCIAMRRGNNMFIC